MKNNKTTLYKFNYTYTFSNSLDVNISEYEVYEKDGIYVDANDEFVADKKTLGKLEPHFCSMWLLNKDVRYYVNALIRRKDEARRELERFVDACTEYKNSLALENKPNVKIYCFAYSFQTGLITLNYDATEHEDHYCLDSHTIIAKDIIDELINNQNGNIVMYSLEDDKEKFLHSLTEHIKDYF